MIATLVLLPIVAGGLLIIAGRDDTCFPAMASVEAAYRGYFCAHGQFPPNLEAALAEADPGHKWVISVAAQDYHFRVAPRVVSKDEARFGFSGTTFWLPWTREKALKAAEIRCGRR